MKTVFATQKTVKNEWFHIDATDLVLGRLATIVVDIIRGKHKASYTPHIDCGDFVVITNAEKIALTGKKLKNKVYYKHTGFPGGIKESTPGEILSGNYPERVIQKAVERMIARNRHSRAAGAMAKLKVYKGASHPHEAQNPKTLDIAARNKKNKRG